MDILFFDSEKHASQLLPFTYTRPVSDIRIGIFKIHEKWNHYFEGNTHFRCFPHLSEKFPNSFTSGLVVNGGLCPNRALIQEIDSLKEGESLFAGDTFLAKKTDNFSGEDFDPEKESQRVSYDGPYILIQDPWNIFQFNAEQIASDIEVIKLKRSSTEIEDPHTIVYGDNIFIEEGASIRASIINTEKGPVYIGKNAVVHEGSIINGAFALCEGSHVNIGAKIKGDSTIGPFSKVGGEVSNSVIFGYSNKGHDGFLGNSVIGEWCNLGADTNTSNLKNNYASVKLWSYEKSGFKDTGLQFCGLVMGDHAKCGINTMFNTGTVVGTGANVFGSGFPRNYIPEFAWGGAQGFSSFRIPKFFETAEKVMERRNIKLTASDKKIFEWVFENSSKNRFWEKTEKE